MKEQDIKYTIKVKCTICLNEIKVVNSFLEEDGSYYCEPCYDKYLDKINEEEERIGMTNQEIKEQAEKMYPEYPTEPKGETRYNKDINCFKKRKAFIKGAKWMQEQDEWISCDLKPEKEFIDILLLFENECSCSGYYVQEHDVFMPHNVMYRGLTVTHWKPFTLTT